MFTFQIPRTVAEQKKSEARGHSIDFNFVTACYQVTFILET
jgi:hypothetical protein